MPRTPAGVDGWARDPANRNRHQGDGWHNLCEQFVNNAGDFNQSFETALAAGNASGPLDPDIGTITDGSIGYWSGVWINGEECGHVAFWLHGRWLMASDACTEKIGNGTGTIAFADYARLRPAAKWRGHSKRHGAETLAGASSTAGSTLTPVGDTMLKDDEDLKNQLNEIQRMLGIMLGWGRATNQAEVIAGNVPANVLETRRMLAEILTGSPAPDGAPAEAALWNNLRTSGGSSQIDYTLLAKAVNDDAARRLAN